MGGEKVSVAMCTYNGEQYIGEQLESILNQTRKPDELVVCDDGSTDGTLDVLREFMRKSPFSVKVEKNEVRLGPSANFGKAIRKTNGDVIFLSDQDDVWEENKIEKILSAFKENKDAAYVFSNATVIGSDSRKLNYTLWDANAFSRKERHLFASGYQMEVLLRHTVVTGATMAFRSEYKDFVLPVPTGWMHDSWLVLCLSFVSKGVFVEEPLVRYRVHPKQVIGVKKRHSLKKLGDIAIERDAVLFDEAINGFLELLKRAENYKEYDNGRSFEHSARLVRDKMEHFKARKSLLTSRDLLGSVTLLLRELFVGRYFKYYSEPGLSVALKDFMRIAVRSRRK